MSLIAWDLQQIYINQNKLKISYFQSVFKLGRKYVEYDFKPIYRFMDG